MQPWVVLNVCTYSILFEPGKDVLSHFFRVSVVDWWDCSVLWRRCLVSELFRGEVHIRKTDWSVHLFVR